MYDPFVPSIRTRAGVLASVGSAEKALYGADCTIFLVDHDQFREISLDKIKKLMAFPVLVDGEGIVYLGIGKGYNL